MPAQLVRIPSVDGGHAVADQHGGSIQGVVHSSTTSTANVSSASPTIHITAAVNNSDEKHHNTAATDSDAGSADKTNKFTHKKSRFTVKTITSKEVC